MKVSLNLEESRSRTGGARASHRCPDRTETSSAPQSAHTPADPEFDFFFEILPRMCFQVDPAGHLLRVNSTAMAMLGHDRHELLNRPLSEFVPPDDQKRLEEKLEQCLSSIGKSVEWDLRLLTKNGNLLQVRTKCLGLRASGGGSFALLVGEEKFDRADPEQELAACRECLRRMTSELSRTEENERRRAATTLHQLVGGGLVAAQLKLGELGATVPHELSAAVEEIRDHLKSVIQSTRELTFRISNPLLYEVGLEAALEQLVTSLAKEQMLHAEVELGAEPMPLPENLSTVLYQVLRDVLFEVVVPSQAKTVRLTTRTQGDQLIITVEHDGEGFDAAELGSRLPGAIGLRFLKARQRIAGIGGELAIDCTPGRGTRVELSAPVGCDTETPGRL